MTLDSWLVDRLARELHAALAGWRIDEIRSSESGAPGLTIECRRRRAYTSLRVSVDPQRPLAAIEPEPAVKESGPGGWAGGVAPLLRGSVVDAIHAVPNDRVLNVDVISRSAFGVPARHRLAFELEPRRANALVLRPTEDNGWIVLAAAKQFAGSDGGRDLAVGERYEPPPPMSSLLDRKAFLDGVGLETDVIVVGAPEPQTRGLARLLREFDPTCTPPLAREVVERTLTAAPLETLGVALLENWATLRADVAGNTKDLTARVFAYRRGDEVVACHVVPLSWPAGERSEFASLNEVCALELARAQQVRGSPAGTALRKKLELMLTRGAAESERLRGALERAQQADSFRVAGDAIYANLATIPAGSTVFVTPDGTPIALDPLLTPKQNAADYFRRYKKARSGVPRIRARIAALGANREFFEQLLWELDRAVAQPAFAADIHADVAAAIGHRGSADSGTRAVRPAKKSHGRLPKRSSAGKARAPAGVSLADGAVAYVGRSPRDNERLTFTLARPNDYWFHARGIPGAHVILKTKAGAVPTPVQIEAAAALAAGASRAAGAVKVEVDYTQRKHVRRQGKGATGLVWYTDVKTILVTPKRV